MKTQLRIIGLVCLLTQLVFTMTLLSAGLQNGDFEQDLSVGWTVAMSGSPVYATRQTSVCGSGSELYLYRYNLNDWASVSQTCDANAPTRISFKAQLLGQESWMNLYGWGKAWIAFHFRDAGSNDLATIYWVSRLGNGFAGGTVVTHRVPDDNCNAFSFAVGTQVAADLPTVNISLIRSVQVVIGVNGDVLRGTGIAHVDDITIQAVSPSYPVKTILDTDLAADCDDLGAVAVLHALANQGKAQILGMVCNVSDPYSPLCLSAVNTYYGRPNIPIGYVGNDPYVSPDFEPVSCAAYLVGENRYTTYIGDANNYLRNYVTNTVPDALSVYTNLLANNSNVTIVSIGSLYNLDKLLKTRPDLVRNSVSRLVVMGGTYPSTGVFLRWPDFNFTLWVDAAIDVVSNWPTPIYFSGLGFDVHTGTALFSDSNVATNNPIRKGYELGTASDRADTGQSGGSHWRPSWDQIAVLYAMEGANTNFVESNGSNAVHELLGSIPLAWNDWTDFMGGPHYYITSLVSTNELANYIESLMVQTPIPRAPSNLAATSFSTNQIILTWQRNADNEDGYKIERSTNGVNFDEIGFTMGAVSSSFSDNTGFSSCTAYYYRVRAYNSSGDSDFSNIANVTTGPGLADGLVAYYPFNGSANDASGNGNNASFIGTNYFFTSDPACTISNDTYIDAGNIFPPKQDALTESCWIKSTQQQQPIGNGYLKHLVFMTRRTGTNTLPTWSFGGWATLNINNQGFLALTVDDDYYGNYCLNANYTAASVFDGKWHHIVGVKSNTLYSLYFDGEPIATISDSRVLSASDGTEHFWIGRHRSE